VESLTPCRVVFNRQNASQATKDKGVRFLPPGTSYNLDPCSCNCNSKDYKGTMQTLRSKADGAKQVPGVESGASELVLGHL